MTSWVCEGACAAASAAQRIAAAIDSVAAVRLAARELPVTPASL